MRLSPECYKILQITDTHLYAVPTATLLKMNTHESFAAVLKALLENESDVDLVIATGDIAQDGTRSAYDHFLSSMRQLAAPVRWIPGNHDQGEVMQDAGYESGACNKVERLGNWKIILLDSSRANHVDGYLDHEELEFLAAELAQAESDPGIDHCLVTLHHNPVPGSSSWMRDIGLRNDREFIELLREHQTVRCVVYGHIHQDLDFKIGDIRYFCTPSTCIQFKPEVIDFALDVRNPGYRRLELYRDGSIRSEVVRVQGDGFAADLESSGY